MSTPLLDVQGLVRSFHGVRALRGAKVAVR